MTTYLFTYGTLRPSMALDDLTPGHHVGKGYLPGAKLYRHSAARFPVLVESPESLTGDDYGVVVGDVFAIDTRRSRQLDFIIDMEYGAGYDVRIREVTLTSEYDTVPAIVFTWPERQGVGPLIPSGDFLASDARRIVNELPLNAGFVTRN